MRFRQRRFVPSLPFVLLVIFLGSLLLSGGASRADALGQALARSGAWIVLIIVALFGARNPDAKSRALQPVAVFLGCIAIIAVIQLIPLPPSWWQLLPNRALLADAARATGEVQPWRPWSIAPSATLNALFSLVVPLATLVMVNRLCDREYQWLPGLVLCLIAGSMLAGLVQVAGLPLDNPLINDAAGVVSGTFANRNHFALFLAIGCIVAPVWAFQFGSDAPWRGLAALSLVVLFSLTNLATGSRAGIVLAIVGLGGGLFLVRRAILVSLRWHSRWVKIAIFGGIIAVLASFAVVSIVSNRALSVDRALALNLGDDVRSRALPAIMTMVREYFPFGAGLGTFDASFRIQEPMGLLRTTYLNHAHDDWLELVLDAGLLGLVLLVATIAWWSFATARAWRGGVGREALRSRLGSAVLLLVAGASVVDYPARTPIIMSIMVIAATWLSNSRKGDRASSANLSKTPRSEPQSRAT